MSVKLDKVESLFPKSKITFHWILIISVLGALTSTSAFIAIKFISLQTVGVISNSKAFIGFILGVLFLGEKVNVFKVVLI